MGELITLGRYLATSWQHSSQMIFKQSTLVTEPKRSGFYYTYDDPFLGGLVPPLTPLLPLSFGPLSTSLLSSMSSSILPQHTHYWFPIRDCYSEDIRDHKNNRRLPPLPPMLSFIFEMKNLKTFPLKVARLLKFVLACPPSYLNER